MFTFGFESYIVDDCSRLQFWVGQCCFAEIIVKCSVWVMVVGFSLLSIELRRLNKPWVVCDQSSSGSGGWTSSSWWALVLRRSSNTLDRVLVSCSKILNVVNISSVSVHQLLNGQQNRNGIVCYQQRITTNQNEIAQCDCKLTTMVDQWTRHRSYVYTNNQHIFWRIWNNM